MKYGGRLLRNHETRSSAEQERDDRLRLELLKRAVQQGIDEIDRGEFVVVEPDEIDSFVDKLAAKVMKRKR
jgi:hypothetical protein